MVAYFESGSAGEFARLCNCFDRGQIGNPLTDKSKNITISTLNSKFPVSAKEKMESHLPIRDKSVSNIWYLLT
jgi:hypothetical protein